MKSALTIFIVLSLQLAYAQTGEMGIRTTVFVDENANGLKDSNELRIGDLGITIEFELFDENMNLLGTEPTDQYGSTRFFGLAEGSYYLQFQPAYRYRLSSPITNINDDDVINDDNGIQEDNNGDGITEGLIRSPLITLELGTEATNEHPLFNDEDFGPIDENNNWTVDFGVVPCKTFDGEIFLDSNNNGCREIGEDDLRTNLFLYLCESGVADSIGQGRLISFDTDLFDLSRDACLTSANNYYLEVETNKDALFNSNDSCSLITYNQFSSTIGQTECFDIDNLLNQEIELGYNDITSSIGNQIKKNVKVYPNPARQILIVDSEIPLTTISLYDTSGIKVSETKARGEQDIISLDVSQLITGFYFLELKSEDRLETVKVSIGN